MSKEVEKEFMNDITSKVELTVAPEDIAMLLYDIYDVPSGICEQIKDMAHRLESIDNANPSEALECLEAISKEEIVVRNRSSIYMNPDDNNKGAFTHLTTVGSYFKLLETIKQALLKAQEPKQYLKWEDLEFKEERQEIPVRMGETIYILVLRKTDGGNKIAKLLSPKRNYMGEWGDMFYEEAKQFFNDLHLERVEE